MGGQKSDVYQGEWRRPLLRPAVGLSVKGTPLCAPLRLPKDTGELPWEPLTAQMS